MQHEDYKLMFEGRGSYLYVYLTGRDSFAAALSYWNEIADRVKKQGYKKVLVHEDLIGDVSEGEVFDIVLDLIKESHGVRVAFFDENSLNSKTNELGQLIATNRGADVRIFNTLEDARSWIEQDD